MGWKEGQWRQSISHRIPAFWVNNWLFQFPRKSKICSAIGNGQYRLEEVIPPLLLFPLLPHFFGNFFFGHATVFYVFIRWLDIYRCIGCRNRVIVISRNHITITSHSRWCCSVMFRWDICVVQVVAWNSAPICIHLKILSSSISNDSGIKELKPIPLNKCRKGIIFIVLFFVLSKIY